MVIWWWFMVESVKKTPNKNKSPSVSQEGLLIKTGPKFAVFHQGSPVLPNELVLGHAPPEDVGFIVGFRKDSNGYLPWFQWLPSLIPMVTFPDSNGWKMIFLLRCHCFRCHVSFREGTFPETNSSPIFRPSWHARQCLKMFLSQRWNMLVT